MSEEYNLNKMVAETHLIDRSRVEKVKRNLFGTPTEDEKKLFHSEYEKTINEERKVNSEHIIIRLDKVSTNYAIGLHGLS